MQNQQDRPSRSRSLQINPLAKLTRSLSVDSFMEFVKTHQKSQVQQDQLNVTMIQQDLDSLSFVPTSTPLAGKVERERGLPAACIFVAHLEANVTDSVIHASLFKLLAQYGFILDLQVHRDQKYRPYAFCQFRHQSDAIRALETAQSAILFGRPIRLEHARVNRTIFISKMEREMTEIQIREILGQYGPLEEIKLLRDEVGFFKGCLFCRYCYREDAIAAVLALETFEWKIEWVNNQQAKLNSNAPVEEESRYIGKLPLRVTENDLLSKFSAYGTITTLNLVRRSTGTRAPLGASNYAFLTYTSSDAVNAAIEGENGSKWFDRQIGVAHRLSQNGSPNSTRPGHHPLHRPRRPQTMTPLNW